MPRWDSERPSRLLLAWPITGGLGAFRWASRCGSFALIAAIRAVRACVSPGRLPGRLAVLTNPQVRVLALVAVPEGAAVFGFIVFYAPALTSAGRSPAISALGVAGVGIGMLLGGLVVGRLTGQIADRRLIAIGASILTVGYLVATDITLPTILAASVLTGIGQSGIHSCLQRWATEAAPEARGVSTALFAAGAFSGAGLAALLGVVIAGHCAPVHLRRRQRRKRRGARISAADRTPTPLNHATYHESAPRNG